MYNEGLIFVLTGPSGSGKTTNWKEICKKRKDTAEPSIVYTTRLKRNGENSGEQYYFITDNEFDKMVHENKFVCYTTFCGKKYGLSKEYVNKVISQDKKDLIFDSIMPVEYVKSISKNVIVIYLTTTTDEELKNRIIARVNGNITKEEIESRMKDAKKQKEEVLPQSDYVVVTDNTRTKEAIVDEIMYRIDNVKIEYEKNKNIYPNKLAQFFSKNYIN